METLAFFAIFLPIIGSVLTIPFGRAWGDHAAMAVSVACLCLAAIFSVIVFFNIIGDGNDFVLTLFHWMAVGDLEVTWALKFDSLTAVMLIVVNGVSSMVHIYSIGYMHHDPHRPRFFAYLSMFTFMMLMLVSADNLVQLFFGWEGVGVASYLLIGFWYDRESANKASMKAFVVNRVGDFGFALGIFAIFFLFGSVDFDTIFEGAPGLADATFNFLGWEVHALTTACLLLFVGAMGKSAQLGLHTWLPDAMEGPTPVSALIHAATMVTAGVFMLARMSPLFEYAPWALLVVCIVGALTAFIGATIGMTQWDIKRVIAYSTMSQLGYMFFAIGVSAYQAAIFHLMTHAFFKSLLFLSAGSVIHAMSDEQDMRKMGGLARHIPWTYSMMWIGSLALAGIGIPLTFGIPFLSELPGIGFAGFYSKDLIIEAAFADHTWFGELAYWLGTLAAFMTAFYSGRLIFLTFHGKSRVEEKVAAHLHESPWVMLGPLCVLGFGATFAGAIGYYWLVGHGMEGFWGHSVLVLPGNDTIEAAHHVALWVKLLPLALAVSGLIIAWLYYMVIPSLPAVTVRAFKPIYYLFFHKWYFDELYDATFVRGAQKGGEELWKVGDQKIIDGLGPDGFASASRMLAGRFSRLQSGYLYHYAFAMLIGVVVFVSWYLYTLLG
ncbi:MAG: NADH-quinone oxidoreductase subunit L [Pseudomonadota bacterium]